MKNNRYLITGGVIFALLLLTGCKFYFNEDEYLGTYNGYLESNVVTYKSCNGQLIITDAGDFKVNMELITDSNPTYYFTGISVERGYSLSSQYLNFYDNITYGVDAEVNRINHSVHLSYYDGGSYYDYYFNGDRQ
jgi:hypothetical protein